MCDKGWRVDFCTLDRDRQLTMTDREMSRNCAQIIAVIVFLLAANISAGQAQDNGCKAEDLSDPPRLVYRCANGLLVEAEALAELGFATSPGQGASGPASVSEGAVLIDLQGGVGPFQISTPHAIASVRGTVFVVDPQPLRTSVFVVEGLVMVSRADGSTPVELGAGDGVDVSPDKPLTVRQWSQERVAILLARFAR